MREIAEFVAVLSCSLFTGASVYINLVEHPARMQCGVEVAATEFAPSYRRATVMQATSAALGSRVIRKTRMACGATFWWLVAGVLLGSVIPFTLFVILPTNTQLLSPTLDRRSVEAERLLGRWRSLHAVRSVLSGFGTASISVFDNLQRVSLSSVTRIPARVRRPPERTHGCRSRSARCPPNTWIVLVPAQYLPAVAHTARNQILLTSFDRDALSGNQQRIAALHY